jgi:TolB protein
MGLMNLFCRLILALTLVIAGFSVSSSQIKIVGQKKLTNIENSYPYWSPDGSKIVFSSNRDGDDEIYVMNADGSHQVRLTNHTQNDGGPRWSPDGSKIVFVSERDGNAEIYVMNADGSSQRRLTRSPADDSHPNWSPDGSRIIFNSNKDTPDPKLDWWEQYHNIYTMNLDGGDLRQITHCRTVCTFPSYSPDGKRISYRKVIAAPGFYDDKNLTLAATDSEVFVANSDGTNEIDLSRSAAYDAWPSWSPDGSRIIFASNRGAVTQIYVVNADGSNLTRLVNDRDTEEDARPQWSPDGSKVAFTRTRNGAMDIYVLELGSVGQSGSAVTKAP